MTGCYAFAGYIDYPNKSAYDRMWEDIRWQHINWDTWEFPSDEEVDAYVAEALLKAENPCTKSIRNGGGIQIIRMV